MQNKQAKGFEETTSGEGLVGVSRKYQALLEPMAMYIVTKIMKENPPRMATGSAFDKRVAYTDIQTDVNKSMPAIIGLTAIYDNRIVTAAKDYNGFIVTCYTKKRDEAKNWMENFEHKMRTQNQYRGKCLYASDDTIHFREIPEVSWDDVVLSDKVKKDIRLNTVTFLGDEKLSKVGVLKRGLIMYGPPGTGKTSVVKSIFRELEGKKVSRIYVTAESFKYMPMGNLFDLMGYLGSSILAFEDVDMVGTSRDIVKGSGVLGDLLTNLDGMRKHNDPLVVIASTNKIEMLDSALANRPCRFDRKIEIGLPNDDLLKRLYFKFIGKDVNDNTIRLSKGFTGSHVVEAVNTAKILAMNEDKEPINCLIEACNIIRENFFPGQTTEQIKVAVKKSMLKTGYVNSKFNKKANKEFQPTFTTHSICEF